MLWQEPDSLAFVARGREYRSEFHIDPADEVRREFLFLSVMRSQPAVSWIGFGFPDGRFFGAPEPGSVGSSWTMLKANTADGPRRVRPPQKPCAGRS